MCPYTILNFQALLTCYKLLYCLKVKPLYTLTYIEVVVWHRHENIRQKLLKVRAPRENKKKEKEAKQLYIQCTPRGLEIRKYRRLKAMPSDKSNKLLRIQKTNVCSNVMVLPYAVKTHKYDFCLFYSATTTS